MIPDRRVLSQRIEERLNEQNIMDSFVIINLTIWMKWINGQKIQVPKLTQQVVNNLSIYLSGYEEIEFVVKNLPTKETLSH